jgi:hypothetical protein
LVSSTAYPYRALRAENQAGGGVRAAPVLGQPIWVIGFPLGRHIMLSSGIVSQVMLDDGEQAAYIDVPVPGQTLVTPLADIKRFLDQFEQADLLHSGSP